MIDLPVKKIGEIHSIYFPPQVILDENGLARLARNEVYRYRATGKDLVFLVGDHQIRRTRGTTSSLTRTPTIAESRRKTYLHARWIRCRPSGERAPGVLGAMTGWELRRNSKPRVSRLTVTNRGGGIIGQPGTDARARRTTRH